MLLEHDRYYGLGMDALAMVCSWNTLGMDVLVSLCSWNSNGIMVWAWMLWSSYALRAAPHGGNAFPLRTDPGASPASKKPCWNHRTQGPRGCIPPKTSHKSQFEVAEKCTPNLANQEPALKAVTAKDPSLSLQHGLRTGLSREIRCLIPSLSHYGGGSQQFRLLSQAGW